MKDFASPVSRGYTRIGDTSSIFLLRARRVGPVPTRLEMSRDIRETSRANLQMSRSHIDK